MAYPIVIPSWLYLASMENMKYESTYCCVGVKLGLIANTGEFAHNTKHILNAK